MTTAPAPADGGCAMAELFDAMPDPQAELELRRQLVGEAHRDGYERGFTEGAAAQAIAYKTVLLSIYRCARLELRRWHVCCGSCRRTGHRDGCARCEDRFRETYGQTHPDDFPERKVTAA